MKITATRFWHLMAMAPAVLLLTGWKAEGCWDEVIVEPPPPPVCQAGTHLETVCDEKPVPPIPCGPNELCAPSKKAGEGATSSCREECVPDEVCPAGYVEQLQCAPIEIDPTYCVLSECKCPPNADCDCAPSYCEPVEEECWIECVPACPEGTHPELICKGCGHEDGCFEPESLAPHPPPEDDCIMECVADDICPPGYEEVGVCDGCAAEDAAEDGVSCEGGCWTECWPVDPTCPPGCFGQMICEYCAEGDDCVGGCYSSCICAGPAPPPDEPETH